MWLKTVNMPVAHEALIQLRCCLRQWSSCATNLMQCLHNSFSFTSYTMSLSCVKNYTIRWRIKMTHRWQRAFRITIHYALYVRHHLHCVISVYQSPINKCCTIYFAILYYDVIHTRFVKSRTCQWRRTTSGKWRTSVCNLNYACLSYELQITSFCNRRK